MTQPMFNATNFPRDLSSFLEVFGMTGDQRTASPEEPTTNRMNYHHTVLNAINSQVIPPSPLLGSTLDPAQMEYAQQNVPFHAFVRSEPMTLGQMAESFGVEPEDLASVFTGISANETDDVTKARAEYLATYILTGQFGSGDNVLTLESPELVPDKVPVRQEALDERSTPVDVSYLGSENNVDKLNNPSAAESERLQSIRLHNLLGAELNKDATGDFSQLTRLGSAGIHGAAGMLGAVSGGTKPAEQTMRDYRLLQEPDGHLAFHTNYYRRGKPGEYGEMPLIRGQDGIPNYTGEMATSLSGMGAVAENDPQRGMGPIMSAGRSMGSRVSDAVMTGDYFSDYGIPLYGAGGDQAAASQALNTGGYVVPNNIQEGKEQEFYDLSKEEMKSADKAYDYMGASSKNLDKKIERIHGFGGVGDTTGYASPVMTGLMNVPADLAGRDRTSQAFLPVGAAQSMLKQGAKGGTTGSIKALLRGLGDAGFEEASEYAYYTPGMHGAITGNPMDALKRQETNTFMGDVSAEDPDYEDKFMEQGVKYNLQRRDITDRYNNLLKK